MVRLDPILSDPDEDRMYNKIGAAMLGAVLGASIGFVIGNSLWPKIWFAVGAIAVGAIGFWFGERFTHFVADMLRNGFRRGPFDRDD